MKKENQGITEWQPIETASRDGNNVLGFDKDNQMSVMWFCDDKWIINITDSMSWNERYVIYPTHWMPLPEPPK